MTLLIATGLRREARLMAGPGIVVIAGGGDAVRLERELEICAGSASVILSSGLAGALDPDLIAGDIVIGGRCFDGAGTGAANEPFVATLKAFLPDARVGIVVGQPRPAARAMEKHALRAQTRASAADMESHIAARVAERHGLPFAALRVISDRADDTLPPAALAGMRPDGRIAPGAVLASLLGRPGQLPALLRTARDARVAFRTLGRVHDVLRSRGIGRLDPGKLALDMR